MAWSIFYSGLATFCNEKAKPDVWHRGPYLFSTLSSLFLSPSSFNLFFIARVWLRPISGLASCRDIILFSSVNEDTEFFKSTSSQTPRFVLFILACLLFFPSTSSCQFCMQCLLWSRMPLLVPHGLHVLSGTPKQYHTHLSTKFHAGLLSEFIVVLFFKVNFIKRTEELRCTFICIRSLRNAGVKLCRKLYEHNIDENMFVCMERTTDLEEAQKQTCHLWTFNHDFTES